MTSEIADVVYRQTNYYDPLLERSIAHDDPDVGIVWPDGLELTLSARESAAPTLRELADELAASFAIDGAGR